MSENQTTCRCAECGAIWRTELQRDLCCTAAPEFPQTTPAATLTEKERVAIAICRSGAFSAGPCECSKKGERPGWSKQRCADNLIAARNVLEEQATGMWSAPRT